MSSGGMTQPVGLDGVLRKRAFVLRGDRRKQGLQIQRPAQAGFSIASQFHGNGAASHPGNPAAAGRLGQAGA
jgi:hypothetical protein